jgi:hypothetical protein
VDFRAGEVEGGFVDNVSLANLARQPERARQLHPLEPIPVWFIFSRFRHLSAVDGIQTVLFGVCHFFNASPSSIANCE